MVKASAIGQQTHRRPLGGQPLIECNRRGSTSGQKVGGILTETDDAIIGVGSPHGDDQVGWMAIEMLQQEPSVNARLCAVGDPVDILERASGVRRLWIVDACRSGSEPGQIIRMEWNSDGISEQQWQSTHRISLMETLQLADTLGRLPDEVIVYGIEIAQCLPQSQVCTAVTAALPQLVGMIRSELASQQSE